MFLWLRDIDLHGVVVVEIKVLCWLWAREARTGLKVKV